MNAEKSSCENVRPQISSFVKKFHRLLQNRVQATHIFLGWGAPGLGDDLGWGGEATRDAHGCGGGPSPLGLLERDISPYCHMRRINSTRCLRLIMFVTDRVCVCHVRC